MGEECLMQVIQSKERPKGTTHWRDALSGMIKKFATSQFLVNSELYRLLKEYSDKLTCSTLILMLTRNENTSYLLYLQNNKFHSSIVKSILCKRNMCLYCNNAFVDSNDLEQAGLTVWNCIVLCGQPQDGSVAFPLLDDDSKCYYEIRRRPANATCHML